MKPIRLFLNLLMSASLLAHPVAGASNMTVGAEQIQKASKFRAAQWASQISLKRSLKTSAAATGHFLNEVVQFQALLIMISVVHYQMVKQRSELEALGKAPKPEDQVSQTTQELCTQHANGGINASADMLCSGDFLLGTLASGALVLGNGLVSQIFKAMSRAPKQRSALFKVISSLGSMSLMITGGVAAGMLWTEATRSLESEQEREGSKHLAGRAAKAWATRSWDSFQASPDGKLWATIQSNIYKIVLEDENLRSLWLTNFLRLGIKGELLTAIPTLMGSEAIGSLLGSLSAAGVGYVTTSAGLTVAAAGLGYHTAYAGLAVALAEGTVIAMSAPVLSFIIGAGIGFYSLNSILESGITADINERLQNFRASANESGLDRNLHELRLATFQFRNDLNSGLEQQDKRNYDQITNRLLDERKALRENYATALIEQLYELRLKIETAKQSLQVAEATIANPNLTQLVKVEINGKIQNLEDVLEQTCKLENCTTKQVTELTRFKELTQTIAEAEDYARHAGMRVIALYMKDASQIHELSFDARYTFPFKLKSRLTQDTENLAKIQDYFKFVFANISPAIARVWPDQVSGDAKANKTLALNELAEHYQLTFNESKLLTSLEAVTP